MTNGSFVNAWQWQRQRHKTFSWLLPPTSAASSHLTRPVPPISLWDGGAVQACCHPHGNGLHLLRIPWGLCIYTLYPYCLLYIVYCIVRLLYPKSPSIPLKVWCVVSISTVTMMSVKWGFYIHSHPHIEMSTVTLAETAPRRYTTLVYNLTWHSANYIIGSKIDFKNQSQQEERRVLDDIVPAIEGVISALPEVQRPRNPEVIIIRAIGLSLKCNFRILDLTHNFWWTNCPTYNFYSLSFSFFLVLRVHHTTSQCKIQWAISQKTISGHNFWLECRCPTKVMSI